MYTKANNGDYSIMAKPAETIEGIVNFRTVEGNRCDLLFERIGDSFQFPLFCQFYELQLSDYIFM